MFRKDHDNVPLILASTARKNWHQYRKGSEQFRHVSSLSGLPSVTRVTDITDVTMMLSHPALLSVKHS